VREVLGVPELLTLHQVHSANVVAVDEPWGDARPQADAMVTNRRGVALGILTADCVPVLFADSEAGVIGAAHAGWKGALAGVIGETVVAMERLGARRDGIAAVIGPCISQANYEVGDELRDRFVSADPNYAAFFTEGVRDGHWQFDLEGFVAGQLVAAGVGSIERLSTCTYANEDGFFSFRRATHRGEKDYGRQISAIALI
jgi:YfiH family protein